MAEKRLLMVASMVAGTIAVIVIVIVISFTLVLRLYGPSPRIRSYFLGQLRTGHSWLAISGKERRLRDDDKCVRGARETVIHVLVGCPKLCDLRPATP